MPTKKKRLMFAPTPETWAVLHRLSRVTKQPVSALVAESMEVLNDHLTNMCEVLEQAEALTLEQKAVVKAAADSAHDALLPHILHARAVMGELSRTIEDATAPADASGEPPDSNTGVTWPPNPLPGPGEGVA